MTLVELDAKTGKILKQFANSDFSILQSPKYHGSGTKIVYLKVNQQGTAIEELEGEIGKNKSIDDVDEEPVEEQPSGNDTAWKKWYFEY